jgi:hypothetical protein
MEIAPVVPLWLTWAVTGGAGMLAIGAVARIFEAVFELEAS